MLLLLELHSHGSELAALDLELQLDLRDASGIPLLLKSGQRHVALLQLQFDLANAHSDLFGSAVRT